jgi:hypothetical protein
MIADLNQAVRQVAATLGFKQGRIAREVENLQFTNTE